MRTGRLPMRCVVSNFTITFHKPETSGKASLAFVHFTRLPFTEFLKWLAPAQVVMELSDSDKRIRLTLSLSFMLERFFEWYVLSVFWKVIQIKVRVIQFYCIFLRTRNVKKDYNSWFSYSSNSWKKPYCTSQTGFHTGTKALPSLAVIEAKQLNKIYV